jgi:Icc-related predicted phosphoesterase
MRLGKLGRGSQRLRLLFATDLHGSEAVFRKFLNAVAVYEVDIAILGGDLTGKRLAPIVEQPKGGFVAEFSGDELLARTEEELEGVIRRIRDAGQYPIRVTPAGYSHLLERSEALDDAFMDACLAQVRDWMNRAAERLEPTGVPLYVTGGNDDYLEIEDVLAQAPYIVNAEARVIQLAENIEMISTGYGNPTPWRCPRDISEDELAARIDEMSSKLRDPRHAIFNLHVPPYASGLDLCPKLDTSTEPPRPIIGEIAPAGSHAVREALERYQPLLSLHGHIHEASGIRQIGHTTAINPGSEYGEGILHSAVIDLIDGQRVSAQLLTV